VRVFNKLTPNLLSLAGLAPPTTAYDPNNDEHIADAWKQPG
jgi:hypothetical protein